MKFRFVLFIILTNAYLVNSQVYNTNDSLTRRCQFLIQAGATYKTFFGQKYIEHPINYSNAGKKSQFEGFTKIPSFGFEGGGIMEVKVTNVLTFTTGILFAFSKDIYEGNIDTVLKYGTSTSIHHVVKYNYSYYDLNIPAKVSLRLKDWILSAGIEVPIITFRTTKYTYYPVSNPYSIYNDELTGKKVKDIKIFRTFFPVLQCSYKWKIKDCLILPYIEIAFGTKSSVFIQPGIIFPLEGNDFSVFNR